MTVIKLENVCVDLRLRPVLNHVSFAAKAGQCLGIVGPNGSGKSTAMKVMAGLLTPKTGAVEIAGRSLNNWRREDLARQVSYLPQGGEVHWPLKARAIVSLGRVPHTRASRLSPADEQAVNESMIKCDISHLAERPVSELSGGERARVLLARTLATEAKIILADEPFAQLDPQHQIHAMEVLKGETSRGACVVVILHDLAIAARHCDRIIVVSNGEIAADDTPALALSSEQLRHVFGIDAFIGEHQGAPIILPIKRRVVL